MTVAGIIAEYNPLHNGHIWHIEQTRAILGKDTPIIVVMSGAVVQRGEAAIFAKHIRAVQAIQAGVNLVLELPAANALCSAPVFARNGVALLEATGLVTHISFGSECGDIEKLRTLQAQLTDISPQIWLRKGLSLPTARQKALEAKLGQPAPAITQRNNILALEYLSAIRTLTPVTIPRQETPHMRTATQLRHMLHTGGDITPFVPFLPDHPPFCLQDGYVLDQLRRMTPADWAMLPDVSEGLQNRLYRAAGMARTLDELHTLVKTKRYTMARIRRIVLRGYLTLPAADMAAYLRVLAFDEIGTSLLAHMRKTARLPVVTRPAAAKALLAAEARVTDILALHTHPPLPRGLEWTTSPAAAKSAAAAAGGGTQGKLF